MSPVSTALLLIGLLVAGVIGYLFYIAAVNKADKAVTLRDLERLAFKLDSGGVVGVDGCLRSVPSVIEVGGRRYNITLAHLVLKSEGVRVNYSRGGWVVWGNGTHAGLVSNVVVRPGKVVYVEYYTPSEKKCGSLSLRVDEEKLVLRVWADRFETPYGSVYFGEPVQVVFIARVLRG